MLIYIEGLDKSGKSTFAKQLSVQLQVPIYRKMPPANLDLFEHHSYFKGVGFALMEIHNLLGLSVIVDRSFISDWVYTNRNDDIRPLDIWKEWEGRHEKPHSVVIAYVEVPLAALEIRLSSAPDPYMSLRDASRFLALYENYLGQTRFRLVRVSGIASTEERSSELNTIEHMVRTF